MWVFFEQNPVVLLIVAPVFLLGVYFTARAVFLAYFHAKRDHLRRFLYELDRKEKHDDSGPRV